MFICYSDSARGFTAIILRGWKEVYANVFFTPMQAKPEIFPTKLWIELCQA